MAKYPGADHSRPSVIRHPNRLETRGITVHWTAGALWGDLETLDGPTVDVHFYVPKRGGVYQILDTDSMAWTAKATANATCLQIETEGRGEAWTQEQFEDMAKLTAWLCDLYDIPVTHVDPPMNWRGVFGHRDLSLGGPQVDGNDHTDTVPDGTGWPKFIARVLDYASGTAAKPDTKFYFEDLPWNAGGDGPRELGPWATEAQRLAVEVAGKALGRIYTRQSIGGKPGLLWWKPGTYDGYPYFFGGYDSLASRDNGQEIWETRLGRKLRPFRGRSRSLYRHRH